MLSQRKIYSLLLALFFTFFASLAGSTTWGTSLFVALGLITILVIIAVVAVTLGTAHKAVKLRTEAQVELESVDGVQIVQVVGNVVGLLELLHDLVVVGVDVLIVTIMDVLGLLLALEQVEEGVAGDRFNNDTLLARLLVLLSLLDLLLGGILTLLPLDDGAFNLNSLVGIVVGEGSERDALVGEEIVLAKGHSDSQLGSGDLLLGGVKLLEVIKNWRVLLGDDGLEHSVVLDGNGPEVGYTRLGFKVVDIGDLVVFLLFFISHFLLLSLDDARDSSLELGHTLVELDASVIKGSVGTIENLVSLLNQGKLALLESLGELTNLFLEKVVDLAALIREDVQALETSFDVLRHTLDDLNHLLLHLALLLASLEKRGVLGALSRVSGLLFSHLVFL